MDSDSLIADACREAVQEMYDTNNTNHAKEIDRLQQLVAQYYTAEVNYWRNKEQPESDNE